MIVARYRLLLLAAAVLLALLALHGTPLGIWIDDYQRVKSWLDRQAVAGPLWFVLAGGGLTAVGVPRLALYFCGGAAFGFAAGLLYAQLGAMLGASLVFAVARWGGRLWVEARLINRRSLRRLLDHRSVLAVFVLRQLPLASAAVSLVLGVRQVPIGVFLLGSFLGFLPEGIPLALLGSGLGKDTLWSSLAQVTAAGFMLMAVAASGVNIYRRWREIEPGECSKH